MIYLHKEMRVDKKIMGTVWWSIHGVIYYSFLKSGLAITADIHCAELRTMMAKLAVKQPRLVNRALPLLQYKMLSHSLSNQDPQTSIAKA